jgi:PAS domain S-box-containing protein
MVNIGKAEQMSTPEEERYHAILLRQRAEEALRGSPIDLDGLAAADIQYLLHELQVHQAELSIQNEELRRVQLELETARDLYSNLYNFAPAGYCTLNRKDAILEANHTLAAMLGARQEDLTHQTLSHFIDRDDQDAYYLHRQRTFDNSHRQVGEIHMRKLTGEKILVRLESMIAHEDHNRVRVILSDITEQQRIEKDAQEAALLRELQYRLTGQREQERQKLARDLHDGPIQGLIAITYALYRILKDLPDPALTSQLETIRDDLKDQIDALRASAMEIRPPMLSKFGLEHTIRSHAATFQKKFPAISIHLELNQTGPLLPETTGLTLFRIYQEALSNIVRHVQSTDTQIHVRMEKDEHRVRLEIQDNGEGFELPQKWVDLVREGHLGLVGMRERADAEGGQLQVLSKKGEGTTIIATIPLD